MDGTAADATETPAAKAAAGWRNIVLFSDGTGNSAASLFKTNVRRLYEALDLTDPRDPQIPRQFAFYDDGVGTSGFRPLAVLGGAFGYGLARNVRDIYAFLCRTYRPGDRIYGFGFSRGAFTMRVVAGLILNQGVVRYDGDEAAFARNVADAFRAYRSERYKENWTLARLLRPVRDAFLGVKRRALGHPVYDPSKNYGYPWQPGSPLEITFLGLWDTVDAYGLPIEELTRAVDTVVWPLTLPNATLLPGVKRACHALCLDDERNTFHPRLWDESKEPEPAPGKGERITQVWFAGMHADVGGGYADDSLARVSLGWMTEHAKANGLRLRPEIVQQQAALADENGPIHDSRRGLASYYRYRPRDVTALTTRPDMKTPHPVTIIKRPKIHESVLRRIAVGQDGYAPISLPHTFDVVQVGGGALMPGDQYLGLTPEAQAVFTERHQHVWTWVWWRRVAYFVTLGGSLALAALPLFEEIKACTSHACVISPAIRAAGALLPGIASTWIETFAANPMTFLVLAAIAGAGFLAGRALDVRVPDEMRCIWYGLTRLVPRKVDGYRFKGWMPPSRVNRLIEGIRTAWAYRWAWNRTSRFVIPSAAFVVAAWLALCVGNLAPLAGQELFDPACQADKAARTVNGWSTARERFDTSSPCFATGLRLEAGSTYRLRIEVPELDPSAKTRWLDGGLPAGPNGIRGADLRWWQTWGMAAMVPLRRHPAEPWFQLMARIGAQGSDTYTPEWRLLPSEGTAQVYEAELHARRPGPLYLYVNDAVLAFDRDHFYRNNCGLAAVTVELRGAARPPLPERGPDAAGAPERPRGDTVSTCAARH